jgi:RNA polymerase sigma-70 factor (ECF subfamily)
MLASSLTRRIAGLDLDESNISTAMTTDERDRQLLKRLAQGDQSALGELYALYGQRLYAFALRLVGDPALAEDVVQDVLVVVWRSARKFRGEGRVIAWLLGIVHHTGIKATRRKTSPLFESAAQSLSAAGPSPEEIVLRDEQARWVQRGLQELSPDHRVVLELVFYHGLRLKEVAEVCDCPMGTVKSRLSYARQHLRGVLARGRGAEEWR